MNLKEQEALDDLEQKAVEYENTLEDDEWMTCAEELQRDIAVLQEFIDRMTPKKKTDYVERLTMRLPDWKHYKHAMYGKETPMDKLGRLEDFEQLLGEPLGNVANRAIAMKPIKGYEPSKVERLFGFKRTYICPNCGNQCLTKRANERNDINFCWNCGQALNWE